MNYIDSLVFHIENKTMTLTSSDIINRKPIGDYNINDIDSLLTKNKFIQLSYKKDYTIFNEIINTNYIVSISINLDYKK